MDRAAGLLVVLFLLVGSRGRTCLCFEQNRATIATSSSGAKKAAFLHHRVVQHSAEALSWGVLHGLLRHLWSFAKGAPQVCGEAPWQWHFRASAAHSFGPCRGSCQSPPGEVHQHNVLAEQPHFCLLPGCAGVGQERGEYWPLLHWGWPRRRWAVLVQSTPFWHALTSGSRKTSSASKLSSLRIAVFSPAKKHRKATKRFGRIYTKRRCPPTESLGAGRMVLWLVRPAWWGGSGSRSTRWLNLLASRRRTSTPSWGGPWSGYREQDS